MAQYTPDEFSDLLSKFARGLPEAIARGELVATQQVFGDISGRIHRRGGTKTITGNTRGYRSEKWVEEREDRGKQINRVDHTISGNLKASYKIFEVQKGYELRIFGSNDDGTTYEEIARGNERWYTQDGLGKVWEASKKEEEKAQKAFNKEINKYIDKFFD